MHLTFQWTCQCCWGVHLMVHLKAHLHLTLTLRVHFRLQLSCTWRCLHDVALASAKEFTKQFNKRKAWACILCCICRCTWVRFHLKRKNVKMHLTLQLMVHLAIQSWMYLLNPKFDTLRVLYILYRAEQTELLTSSY